MCPSVKEGIPHSQVVSLESGALVDQMDLHQIAAGIGKCMVA